MLESVVWYSVQPNLSDAIILLVHLEPVGTTPLSFLPGHVITATSSVSCPLQRFPSG